MLPVTFNEAQIAKDISLDLAVHFNLEWTTYIIPVERKGIKLILLRQGHNYMSGIQKGQTNITISKPPLCPQKWRGPAGTFFM